MSLITTSRVNDHEIGSRKSEIKAIKKEIEEIQNDENMKPSKKKLILDELGSTLTVCKEEYANLCQNVRRNFI